MKYFLIMTALMGGQVQDYRIPMSPVYVNDMASCQHAAGRIIEDYRATQAGFRLISARCVRG
jgi:hypothetical protein